MRCRIVLILAIILPIFGGCSYVCHNYTDFSQPLLVQSEDGGTWTLKGQIERFHREDWQSGPGSWPHWAPAKDDRYRLTLVPLPADTTFWSGSTIYVTEVMVIADLETIPVVWAEVADLPEKHADRRRTYVGRPLWPWPLSEGRLEFTSEFFNLGYNLPDTLVIEGRLDIRSCGSGETIGNVPFRALSLKETHRRWAIADMSES